jgi:HEAT repeat protein
MEKVVIDRLMRHLADVKAPLAVAQLYQLSDLSGPTLARFRETWPQIPVERRRKILGFLTEIAETNFEVNLEPVFRVCITDPDEEVRVGSIEGLWESEDESLIASFLDMAQSDPTVPVRAAAASALGQFVLLGELDRLPAQQRSLIEEILLNLIRSPEESIDVRRRALEALACSSREEVTAIIENAYSHDDRRMRVAAVFAMGRSLDAQWEPLLLDELQSHDPELRYEAARACGELELASALSSLAELLEDPDREVQEASIWALGQIGGQTAHQILQTHYQTIPKDDRALRQALEEAFDEVILASGTVQFPLYGYQTDVESERGSWADDWLDGVARGQSDDDSEDVWPDDFSR